MALWIFLTVLCLIALYLSISINRPILIVATAIASALGLLMIVLRLMVHRKMSRAMGMR
jgi:hypothetical protein